MAGLALPENLPTDPILASGHAPVNLTQAFRILTSRRRSATASRQPSAPLPLRQLRIGGKSHRPKPVGLAALPAPTSGRTLSGQSFLLGLRPEKSPVLQLAQYAGVLHRCAKTVNQTLWGFPFTWGYVSHSNLQKYPLG
jgi:hypothetical protein